jgi:hypothetical protein
MRKKKTAYENERPTKIRRDSSKTVNGLSKGKGPNIRDESSSEKGRATKRKRSDSENERPAKIRIVSPATVAPTSQTTKANMMEWLTVNNVPFKI